jgi:uncharacterized protein YjbI with pentapeptide repeats
LSTEEKVWTRSEIRRRYQDGERDFRGLDISDTGDSTSFRDAVLDGADFSHAFVVADFSRARLCGCRFTEANVKTCSFDEADLRDCDFAGAAIDAADPRLGSTEPTSPAHMNRASAWRPARCPRDGSTPATRRGVLS